ncbi:hypothetical protein GCM10010468_82070 [Actinocorallia longicatena]|uniref:Trypsin n=1 Tax=Actinocorallia longicatena TaxID=111803 RepID=A0ABP6QQ86_9ACTN
MLLDTRSGIGQASGTPVKLPAWGKVTFQATGRGPIPTSDIKALSTGISVLTPAASGWLAVYPSDQAVNVSTSVFTTGESVTVADFTKITSTGMITVDNHSAVALDVVVTTDGFFQDGVGSGYEPITPATLYNTQTGSGSPTRTTPLAAGEVATIDVAGHVGVPAGCQASAVAMNVIVTGQVTSGDLAMWPSDLTEPAPFLRFIPDEPVGSLAISPLTCTGQIKIRNNSAGTVNLQITVRGYFSGTDNDAARFAPVPTKVILDTTSGIGTPTGVATIIPSNGTMTFNAISDLPVEDAARVTAVAFSIKALGTNSVGYLTTYPAGATDPNVPSVSFVSGEQSQAFDVAAPDERGQITVANHASNSTHVQIAVHGYFLTPASVPHTIAPGEFVPLRNTPLLETAKGDGVPGGAVQKVPAGGTMTFQALGKAGIPNTGVAAISLGLAVIKPAAAGTISVYPSDKPTTIASATFTAGESISNADISEVTSTGQLAVKNNSTAPIDVLISADGYVQQSAAGKVYMPVNTAVLWDTRASHTAGFPARTTPLNPWEAVEITAAGQAGFPTDPGQVDAVALNIITIDNGADGDLKVEPIDAPAGIGTLKFTQNDGANSVFSIVPTSHKNRLRVTNNSSGTVHVSISVRGYFTLFDADDRGSRYKVVPTTAVLDTATGVGTGGSTSQLGSEQTLYLDVTGPSGAPVNTVSAVAMQIHVNNPAQGGWITLRPEDKPENWISSVIYQAGESTTGFDLQTPSGLGRIAISNHGSGPVHLTINVRGYYVHKSVEVIEEGNLDLPEEQPYQQAMATSETASTADGAAGLGLASYDPVTKTVVTTATTPQALAEAAKPIKVPAYPDHDPGTGDGAGDDGTNEGPGPSETDESANMGDVEPTPPPVVSVPTVSIVPRPAHAPNDLNQLVDISQELSTLTDTDIPDVTTIRRAYLQPEKNRVIVEAPQPSSALQAGLTSRYGPSKVAIVVSPDGESTSRYCIAGDGTRVELGNRQCVDGAKSPAYRQLAGGARYSTTDGECSLAFAWWLNGKRFFLSAGHCNPSRNRDDIDNFPTWNDAMSPQATENGGGRRVWGDDFYNNYYLRKGTNGNGDLSLLAIRADSHANASIFRYGPKTRDQLLVRGGAVTEQGAREVGELCVGGATTGRRCSYKTTIRTWVKGKDANRSDTWYRTPDNAVIKGVSYAVLTKDGKGGAVYEKDCIDYGDSGGPVYTEITRNKSIVGVHARGIVSGGGYLKSKKYGNYCDLLFTDLYTAVRYRGGGNVASHPLP